MDSKLTSPGARECEFVIPILGIRAILRQTRLILLRRAAYDAINGARLSAPR